MKKAIVLGASGGMGYSLVNELTGRGIEVVAFARNEAKLQSLFASNPFVRIQPGDVLDREVVYMASADVDTVFHSVSISYEQWNEKLPRIMRNVMDVAKGRKLVVVDNVYAYGRQDGKRVSEETEKNPHTKKGKLRLALEQELKASEIPYIIAHFPDFYGPHAGNTILHHTLKSVLLNKKSGYVGSLDIPREFIFTPDGAKALVELAMNESAYGQNWNIPGERLVTGNELVDMIRSLTGYDKKVSSVTKRMIRLAGLFNPFMREFLELSYLYEHPFQLDGRKYEREIGALPRTPYEEGLRQTLAFQAAEVN
ncbi:NAD-dependent epimerase/dehydratase family protein [Sporosarcina cyprini]|uniref:NAD-dependent epimerase/dehydratase family protein n=1 Tax=Sporosarcina cyprini TaxID=2910523 RepID=UPI001EDFA1AF|nr:NAD-dependent epimerase/dehydratase family protein [Sporosarcina cyprini]MCG3086827.1 NAD(P)H-binding protein [Sporosarcina cyprini]